VRQAFPPMRAQYNVATARGLLEVVIDREGAVESATIRKSIHPLYDRILIQEARTWRYTAATRNGSPVRYRKMIEVIVGTP
jgi:TonB family protein